ncbi:MAG: hypothetical protein NVSMB65_00330 [Chloroflexota bacterium]
MSQQVALTIIAAIKPDRVEALKTLLTGMAGSAADNPVLPFGRLAGLHFARLLVLEATVDLQGAPLPPRLVFLSDCDAPINHYMRDLVETCGEGLDTIYRHCENYPPSGATPRMRRDYLRAHRVDAAAVYVNTIGRTVTQIRQEALLREAIEGFLDRTPRLAGDALAIRAAIQRFVDADPDLRWARTPAARPSLRWRLGDTLHLVGVPLLLVALSPAILLALPLWAILLRLHEVADAAPHVAPDPGRARALADLEDVTAQNQFSAVGYLKPGALRRWTAVAVLALANYGTRHIYNRGSLTGVKTIHFARWIFIDDKRRLIFASNYDGSLESYMDDFIDKVAWGLNAVFSNGVGYPRTRWLVLDGATDEEAFKDYLRVHQLPTQVWFSAYDRLTALNVDNNARIRAGLSGPMSLAEAEAWLQRL